MILHIRHVTFFARMRSRCSDRSFVFAFSSLQSESMHSSAFMTNTMTSHSDLFDSLIAEGAGATRTVSPSCLCHTLCRECDESSRRCEICTGWRCKSNSAQQSGRQGSSSSVSLHNRETLLHIHLEVTESCWPGSNLPVPNSFLILRVQIASIGVSIFMKGSDPAES